MGKDLVMAYGAAGPAWLFLCCDTAHGPGVSQSQPSSSLHMGDLQGWGPSCAFQDLLQHPGSLWNYGKGDFLVASTPKSWSDQHRGIISRGKLGYIALLIGEEPP